MRLAIGAKSCTMEQLNELPSQVVLCDIVLTIWVFKNGSAQLPALWCGIGMARKKVWVGVWWYGTGGETHGYTF